MALSNRKAGYSDLPAEIRLMILDWVVEFDQTEDPQIFSHQFPSYYRRLMKIAKTNKTFAYESACVLYGRPLLKFHCYYDAQSFATTISKNHIKYIRRVEVRAGRPHSSCFKEGCDLDYRQYDHEDLARVAQLYPGLRHLTVANLDLARLSGKQQINTLELLKTIVTRFRQSVSHNNAVLSSVVNFNPSKLVFCLDAKEVEPDPGSRKLDLDKNLAQIRAKKFAIRSAASRKGGATKEAKKQEAAKQAEIARQQAVAVAYQTTVMHKMWVEYVAAVLGCQIMWFLG